MNPSNKTVLITGSAGLLGSKLASLYKKNGYFVGATYRTTEPKNYDIKYKIDLSKNYELLAIKDHFQIVINCAGFTDVNENERLPEKSWLENVVASNNVCEFARENKAKFVHISTDHFASNVSVNRKETTPVYPVNQYGYAKLEAEKIILKNNENALIIRSNFFGKNSIKGNSLLEWIFNQIKSEEPIFGFEDVFFNPVSIDYLFNSINKLLDNSAKGIYNIGSKDAISKYNFIKLVFENLGIAQSKLIKSNSEVKTGSVKRPKFMALDCSKFEDAIHSKTPDLSELLRMELMIN